MICRTAHSFAVLSLFALILSNSCFGKTIVLEGKLDSDLRITQHINFSVDRSLSKLSFRLALPADFSNRAVNQTINGLDITYAPKPAHVEDDVDRFGNRYKTIVWASLSSDARVTVAFDASIRTDLSPMDSRAPFPLPPVSQTEKVYLASTKAVQSDSTEIAGLAKELTGRATSEYEAVTSIINFVADTVRYAYNPPEYDALYTLQSKSGNCTNYAHLSLALLRASGIPARFVAGISLNKQWKIPIDDYQSLVQTMGQGKHAWIEIYFTDLGWLSYDPAQSKQFTSTRHIKETHGLDYRDIVGSWSGAPYAPAYSNSIDAHFLDDTIKLKSKYSDAMPKSYLYSSQLLVKTEAISPQPKLLPPGLPEPKIPKPSLPPVEPVKPPPALPETPKPSPPPIEPVKPLPARPEPEPSETRPRPTPARTIEFGNVDFPSLVNAYKIIGNSGTEMLDAETAEYVTSTSVYAQAFKVNGPFLVKTVSLAMHAFGGDGTIYVDLVADEEGRPSSVSGVRSLPLFLDRIERNQGYYWVDFKFAEGAGHGPLKSGKYWIVLRHSGEAIVTWFYTPGKRYGDSDDTRSTMKGYRWEDILNYDLVFKVRGEQL